MALDEATRLREEDAHTEAWTAITETRLVARRSRFEVDVNRDRERCVYQTPEDAWDLDLWAEPPSAELVATSRREYDAFYDVLEGILRRTEAAFGAFVVLDLHSYNHRHRGPEGPPDDPATHPDINVGTRTMYRDHWRPLIDRFVADLRAAELPCGHLDVRENVNFGGAHLPQWVHETFPEAGCALAIEVKKFYVDEHTGELNRPMLDAVGEALASTVDGLLEEVRRL